MAQEFALNDPNLYAHFEDQYGLPRGLLFNQVKAESNFNPNAKSPVGASGLSQFMPATAKEYGVDVNDPVSSLDGQGRYMRDLMKKYGGDANKALAAYNWGMGNLDKHGLEKAPKETRDYIAKITSGLQNAQEPIQVASNEALPQKTMSDATGDADILRQIISNYPEEKVIKFKEKLQTLTPEEREEVKKQLLTRVKGSGVDVTEKPKEPRKLGLGEGLRNEFYQGLTWGGMDEATGYAGAGIQKAIGDERAFGDIAQENLNRSRGEREAFASEYPISSTVANVGGNLLGLPFGLAKTGAGLLGIAGEGALQAGISGFGESEGGIGNRTEGAIKGALTGGALGGLLGGITKLGSKAYNATQGFFSPQAQKASEVDKLAESLGYDPMTYSESVGKQNAPIVSGFETSLEKVPLVGTGDDLIARQKNVQEVTSNLEETQKLKMLDAFENTDYSRIEKYASGEMGAKRQGEASKVLAMIKGAGDNFKNIIQASGNLKVLKRKISADKLYDKARNIGGDFAIKPENLNNALDDVISSKESALIGDADLIKALEGIRKSTKDGYTDLQALQSARDLIQQKRYAPPANVIQDQYQVALGHVERAIGQDIKQLLTNPIHKQDIPSADNPFLKWNKFETTKSKQGDVALEKFKGKYGEAFGGKPLAEQRKAQLKATNDAWNKAESFYQKGVVDYSDRVLGDALTRKDTDTIYDLLYNRGMDSSRDNTQRITRIFKSLDPAGRDASRYGFLQYGLQKATDEKTGMVSPTKLASYMDANKAKMNVFFKGEDKKLLDGHFNILSRLERLGQYAENPPTGNRLGNIGERIIGGGIGGGAVYFGGPTAIAGLATAIGTTKLSKFLLTTPRGKKFLYAAGSLDKSSPKLDNIILRLTKAIPRTVGGGVSEKQELETYGD